MVLGSDRTHLGRPEYEQLVSRLALRERPVESEAVDEVVAALNGVADNGGALVRRFGIVDEDGVFEYVADTPNSSVFSMLESGGFLHDVLRSSALNDSVPGLDTETGFSGFHWHRDDAVDDRDREFDWYHPLLVDGYLAWLLVRGGPYTDFDAGPAEAKALGRRFDRAVFDDRYESFHAWRLENVQWSAWFEGTTHWDETLVIADRDRKEVWLVLFTATD